MTGRVAVRLVVGILTVALTASVATGYIHFPPATLPKMCQQSHHVRLLKVEKCSKEKGVIVFAAAESLKGKNSQITSFKHVLRPDREGTKPILDWLADGKTAVMFTIEAKPGGAPAALGYVFIDEYCYSVTYDHAACWFLIRPEPGLSACYHGSVKQLRELVKAIRD